jgi:hypothetical protein
VIQGAKIDFANSTGIGGQSGTLDPSYKRNISPLACVGGDPSKCTKAGIVGGSWGDSTKASPALLQYSPVPISELLGDHDLSIRTSLEVATEQYVQEGQRRWDSCYSAHLHCKRPFDYKNDPTHCRAPPTPAPTPVPPTPAPCLPPGHACIAGFEKCCPINNVMCIPGIGG